MRELGESRTKPVVENVIAHCGVGGFHRSHLAYATDKVLRSSKSPWGITGVGLMPWDAKMSKTLKDQDMLYTLVMQDADASSARVVEAIVDYVFVPEDAAACVESQPIQDTFILSVPERIFGGSLSSRRELGERIRTVQESWETSSI